MTDEEHGFRFNVIIEQDEDGGYIAEVPSLPGCHTQGDTPEEVRKNIREAIALYIETIGTSIPPGYMEKEFIEVIV
jgi:predicted RNase H-like HicB family nuclease